MNDGLVDPGNLHPSDGEQDQGASTDYASTACNAAQLDGDAPTMADDDPMLSHGELRDAESNADAIAEAEPVDEASRSSEIADLRQHLDEIRTAIGEDLANVARSLGERLSSAGRREEIIDRLHTELQEHRRGSHFLMFKPFFNDLIMFYDHLQRAASDFGDDPSVVEVFTDLSEELEHILERNDLEMFDSGADPHLDRKIQRVVRVETTDDVALDGTIARRLGNGFRYRDEFIVRQEQVVTWKYTPAPDY